MLKIQVNENQTEIENYNDNSHSLVSDSVSAMLKLCDVIAEEKDARMEDVVNWMFLIVSSRTKDYLNIKRIYEETNTLD